MEQKEKTGGKSLRGFAFGTLAVCGALGILDFLASWLIARVFGGISFNVTKAATIGIIGGADGPTSVFITAAAAPAWQLLLWILMLVIGIRGFRHFRKGK